MWFVSRYTSAAPGQYQICLTITDANGCVDTHCNSYYLTKTGQTIVQLEVRPPNTSSVEELDLAEYIQVYPNPARNELNVNYSFNNEVAELRIYNNIGQLVNQQQLNFGNNTLQLNNLSNGIFFVEITTREGVFRKKIVKH